MGGGNNYKILQNLSLANLYNYKYKILKENFSIPINGSIHVEGLRNCKIISINGSPPFNGDSITLIRTKDIQYFRISDHFGFSFIRIDYNQETLAPVTWQGTYPDDNLCFGSIIEVL